MVRGICRSMYLPSGKYNIKRISLKEAEVWMLFAEIKINLQNEGVEKRMEVQKDEALCTIYRKKKSSVVRSLEKWYAKDGPRKPANGQTLKEENKQKILETGKVKNAGIVMFQKLLRNCTL